MIVVSDTSPFIVLAKIGFLHLFKELFGKVIIPIQVHDELTEHENRSHIPTGVADWLTVKTPANLLKIPKLDLGEAAAISLALELNATTLLIDEKAGRKEARSRGIPIVGTIGLLEVAAEKTLIDLQDAFERI